MMTEAREAIRIFRKEACMTQKEPAREIDFSCVSVKRWETGKAMPDTTAVNRLLALAAAKDVSEQCRKHLTQALRAVRQDALNVPNSNLYSVDWDSICQLVDDSHNAVFVCSLKTDELLYVNHKAEEYTGKTFQKGLQLTCYQYFHGRTEPYRKCPKWQLTERNSTDYHEISPQTGRRYHIRGRKIVWNGEPAHAEYFFDETTALERQGGFEKLVDGLDAGICTCRIYDDGQFRMNDMSGGYFSVADSSREKRAQCAGYGVMNAVCPANQERARVIVLAACREQRSFCLTHRILWGDDFLKNVASAQNFSAARMERALTIV